MKKYIKPLLEIHSTQPMSIMALSAYDHQPTNDDDNNSFVKNAWALDMGDEEIDE